MTPQELQQQEQTLEPINSELAARLARQAESGAKVDTKAMVGGGLLGTERGVGDQVRQVRAAADLRALVGVVQSPVRVRAQGDPEADEPAQQAG
ncbi:hypothetical protein [Streptomyces sp. NPDC020571]